jgi:hypothetical protein
MAIDTQLSEIAGQIASSQQYRATTIKNELAEIEVQKAKLQAELDATHLALERLANFKIKIGADYHCPQCWIIGGVYGVIYPIGSGDERRMDRWRCRTCETVFEFPF